MSAPLLIQTDCKVEVVYGARHGNPNAVCVVRTYSGTKRLTRFQISQLWRKVVQFWYRFVLGC